MTLYQNGKVPSAALVALDTPYHWSSAKGAAMWYALRRNVQAKYGVTLRITPGKNAYRDYAAQEFARKNACASGNCSAAAVPGWSSHGGTWNNRGVWVDAMAFDIDNWTDLGEARFFAEARAVGFLADGIRPEVSGGIREPWHLIVLDPWGPVPAGLDSHPLQTPVPAPWDDDEGEIMALHGAAYPRKSDGATVYMLFNEVSGFYSEHTGVGGDYNNPIAVNWNTGTWPTITESHAGALKRSLDAVRRPAEA